MKIIISKNISQLFTTQQLIINRNHNKKSNTHVHKDI